MVGGGITGAGAARDAALRGLSVAVVDQGDWASGTSSKSAKLVHGGLRYLERFQLGLVRESVRERRRQRLLNPNLVWPVPFVMPIYRGGRHSLFKLRLGLWLYDLLALFRNYGRHRRIKAAALEALAPGLDTAELRGALSYYDCGTDDARLTLANVADAVRHGARAANYTRFERPIIRDGAVTGAELRDGISGAAIRVGCRHILFATGPWTDTTEGTPGEGALLRPTKGVHVVVPRERLPVDVAVVMNAPQDGRVLFAIPMDTATYVGTTDTDHDGGMGPVVTERVDVDYLLTAVNACFPGAALGVHDVISTWAGLRPLLNSDADSPYAVSREHAVISDPRGMTTIAGGKLTTYRAMAEDAIDRVIRAGSWKPSRCRTHRVPLDPDLPPDPRRGGGQASSFERMLWRLHGSGAGAVTQRMAADAADAQPVAPPLQCVFAQVHYAVTHEQATRLEDVMVRRLPLYYLAPNQGLGCAAAVAERMARALGRDADWVGAELRAYRTFVASQQAWRSDGLAEVD